MSKIRVAARKSVKLCWVLRASLSDYHRQMLLWMRWGQQRAHWSPGKARSPHLQGSQCMVGGGSEFGSRVKVLILYLRGTEESKREIWQKSECRGSKNWIRTEVSQELGGESKGSRRNRRQAWVDREEEPEGSQSTSPPFPTQWPGPSLVPRGLLRSVALNALRYGRRWTWSSLELRL